MTTTDPTDTVATTPPPRPHVRAGAIAWGLIVLGVCAAALWVVGSATRRAAFDEWVVSLTPGTLVLLGVLLLGGILLIVGALAAIRRGQRALAERALRQV